MTRKLEEEFNLPHLDDLENADNVSEPVDPKQQIAEIEEAMNLSEKINSALSQVRSMDSHDNEMDDIASQAIDSYEQLMSLGMNMTDMAAGPVFANAANMLKIALEAKDSKTTRKLKQIDLMLKKARVDQAEKKLTGGDEIDVESKPLDRNELLKILNNKDN